MHELFNLADEYMQNLGCDPGGTDLSYPTCYSWYFYWKDPGFYTKIIIDQKELDIKLEKLPADPDCLKLLCFYRFRERVLDVIDDIYTLRIRTAKYPQ